MQRLILAVALLTLVALTVGCGGGGGGGTATVPLQSTTRNLVAGDEWQYNITGTGTDGVDTYVVTGSYTNTISAMTVLIPGLTTAYVAMSSMTMTMNGITTTIVNQEYYTQNGQGTVYTFGGEDENGVFYVTSPAIGYYITQLSPLSTGSSWGQHVETTDGTSTDEYYIVTGTDTITVDAGRFETYRVTGNAYIGDIPASITGWYAPQIGAYVRQQATFSFTNGVSMNVAIDLTSRNRTIAVPTATTMTLRQWTAKAFKSGN